MSPLREYRSLTARYEGNVQIEPFRRYYLIFEGANTERKYFQGVDNYRKELGINNRIDLVILHKEGEIRSYSHPKKLLELIEDKKKTLKRNAGFDKTIDRFVIMFDRDSFCIPEDYDEFIRIASDGNILTVTSPCFELWLILHFEDSVKKYIVPNREKVIANDKISRVHSYVSHMYSEISGTNPKSGVFFYKLKDNIDLAITQEKELEQNILKMATHIGSNVGILIEQMRQDSLEVLMDDGKS